MDNWQEIYTAYQVAKHGTVSKAAEVLNVHRATIIRHVDALEKSLSTKLFHRHSRGYTLTEAGSYFLNVAVTADEQFARLKVHLLNDELSGEFIITSLDFITPLILPSIQTFQIQNPKVNVRYLTGMNLLKLEYAQAHIAIRTGTKPQDDDYVVRPFIKSAMGLYASPDYVKKHGIVNNHNLTKHHFICADDKNAKPPIIRWIRANIPQQNIIFTTNDMAVMSNAVIAGIGIGTVREKEAKQHGLIKVRDSEPDWTVPSWLVTHVELHRSEKVQRFLHILKE